MAAWLPTPSATSTAAPAPCARLIDQLPLDRGGDRLWLVGDLVGHGPDSAGTLRRLRELEDELGPRLAVVLGNHDLRLVAARAGAHVPRKVESPPRSDPRRRRRRRLFSTGSLERPLLHDEASDRPGACRSPALVDDRRSARAGERGGVDPRLGAARRIPHARSTVATESAGAKTRARRSSARSRRRAS